jgi:hypothetical protein
VLGARTAALGLLEAALYAMDMRYWDVTWWDHPAVYAAEIILGSIAAGGWGAVRGLWDAHPDARPEMRRGLQVAVGVLAALLLVNGARHRAEFFNVGSGDREPGSFPYKPFQDRFEERSGYGALAHIGPLGYRVSYPEGNEPAEGRTIVFIGDSMVFGLCVEDPESLPWRLREVADAHAPGKVRVINLGQPGANIHSYNDNLRFAIDHLGADAAVIGLHMPNDGEVVDVNAEKPIVRSLPFILAGSMFEPRAAYSSILVVSKVGKSDLLSWRSMNLGLDELDALVREAEIPVLVFAYDAVSRGSYVNGIVAPYVNRAKPLVEANPWMRWAGVISEPEEVDSAPTRIPHDGHPTPIGHAWGATHLTPAWTAFLDELDRGTVGR